MVEFSKRFACRWLCLLLALFATGHGFSQTQLLDVLRLTASDTQFTYADDVTITVHEGINAAPLVNAGTDFLASTTASWRLHSTLNDDGLPNGMLLSHWEKVSGPGAVEFNTLNTIYYARFSAEGDYVLRMTASDGALTNSDDVAVQVYNAPDAPLVAITAPLDAAILTAPTNIIGTVTSSILQKYEVQFRVGSADASSAPFGASPNDWVTIASGSNSVVNGVLGQFDPTLLLNGQYEIRLVATDLLGRSSTTPSISVTVDRKMKVGNFSIAFSDLNIPVSGIPIEVIRSYDTRDPRVGDFGHGWSLGLKNIRLQKNRKLGNNWEQTKQGTFYYLDSRRDRIVTITFPDGDTYKFKATTTPSSQFGQPISAARVKYTALENTRGTLVSLAADADDVIIGGGLGLVDLLEYNGALYNPSRFRFTTVEGDSYVINETTGLESMTDRNGNTLTVTANGITWRNSFTGGEGQGEVASKLLRTFLSS